LKLFHNFCLPQALTKEVINANSGEIPQNSLAELIMQKFIEVFHVVLSVKALSVLGVLFSRAFHRRYEFVRFSTACFPAQLTSCLFSVPFTGDMFSRAFHRQHIFSLSPAPAPCTCSVFSRAFYRSPLQAFALIAVTCCSLFTGIVILFTGIRFQRQSKVTRWNVQQNCSLLLSFETS